MDYKKLLEKYNILLEEVDHLTKENRRLKAKLGLQEPQTFRDTSSAVQMEISVPDGKSNGAKPLANVSSASDSISKIRLFMSLFKGRNDVYAKRWENKNKGTSGYAPVCLNQWQTGVCGKPKIPPSKCLRPFGQQWGKHHIQIKYPPEICHHGSKDRVVWEYQPVKLRKRPGKHHAY